MSKFSKCKILVGKILTIENMLVKFVTLFHCQSFTLYGIVNNMANYLMEYIAVAMLCRFRELSYVH